MKTHRLAKAISGAAIVFSVLFLVAGRGFSQDGEEAAAETTAERTIYVPFTKLKEVFEKEGRGVFLPYEEFEKLWDAAQRQPEPPPQGPPLDSVITAVINEAVVETDVVRVTATLTIELLKKGWNSVPLRLADAAILAAEIEGEAARVTPTEGGGYQLLVENPTEASKTIELTLVYAKAFEKTPGKNSVGFAAPQSPVNRWTIRVPQEGVKVNVDPMIAATEDPAAALDAKQIPPQNAADDSNNPDAINPDASTAESKPEESVKETVLLAFVGAAPRVSIQWTPKAEGATGLDALVSVQAQQEVYVSEGAVRTRANLTYEISRAQISALKVEVPVDHKVVNVFDQNVRKWDVVKEEDAQLILVELFEPAAASQSLTIELEKFHDSDQALELDVAKIQALEVGRQLGTVVVQVDPALRAESRSRTGLQQLDASELPATLAKQNWTFAYRYAALPFSLAVNIEKVQPRITVEQLVQATLSPDAITLESTSVYDIEQAGVFQFELLIPTGYDVQQVVGKEAAGAVAAVVDSFQAAPEEGRQRLVINLARKAFGKIGLSIRLSKQVNDPNLLAPTGTASTFSLDVPQPDQDHLSRTSGKLVVYSTESLRLTPTPSGLRTIALSEAFSPIPSGGDPQSRDAQAVRPILAYEFGEQAASLALSAERRKPYVTARQRLLVQVEEGVIKYESLIMFQIQYSGIKSIRVDLPSEIVGDVRNSVGDLRDTPLLPAPDDVPEGYVAWELTGETELLGNKSIKLTWETSIDELEVGSSTEIQVPRIIPAGVDRAWGQIVITKSPTLDVEPDRGFEGLRPIDPNLDLMAGARVNNAARAFEFIDAWSLNLKATRYQLEEVKRTSIERGLVRTVVTRSGIHNIQALYRVRSARQRLSLSLPEGVEFDTQPVRINGSPVALERGENGLFTIPLVGQDPESSFVLDLRYSRAGNYQHFDLPEFPEDPAVQKVYLAVYLPDEIRLLNSSGPWTEEFSWRWDGLSLQPSPNVSNDSLTTWVGEGIQGNTGPIFQTDGWLYLYSALRPEPPPGGSLQLTTTPEWTLNAAIFGVLLLLGVLMLRTTLGSKFAGVTFLIMAAVGLGVFVPTLAQQLLGWPTIAGLLIVGVGWWAWHANRAYHEIDWQRTIASGIRRKSDPADSSSGTPKFEEASVSSEAAAPSAPSPADDASSEQGGKDV